MVAVTTGARRPGPHRRRANPLSKNRPTNKPKQQLLILPSETEPVPNSSDQPPTYPMAAFECLLGLARAFGMESCLMSAEERRGHQNGNTGNVSPGRRSKRGGKRRPGSRGSSVEGLRGIAGRLTGCGSSLTGAASTFTQQGKKGVNQDAMIVWENFGPRSDSIFCGVFDGHGPFGHLVAKRVRDHLPVQLKSHLLTTEENYENAPSNVSEQTPLIMDSKKSEDKDEKDEEEKSRDFFKTTKESFLKAFKVMDKDLRLHGNIDCFFSGTTAVTVVKQGQDLVIGNLGDSRAIMGTRDANNRLIAVQLTVDLKPNVPREAERIRRCRGRVFALRDEPEVARVWLPNYDTPGLAMARAFGDFCLKSCGLISEPEVTFRRLSVRDEFVVLATDGVWDVLTNKEVVDIIASSPSRSTSARLLVESAVRAWRLKYPTSKIDDCAVVCLYLDSDLTSEAGTSQTFETRLDSTDDMVEGDDVVLGEGLGTRADTLFSLPKYVSKTELIDKKSA
ncbi:hypothetical protein LUZ60_004727 [Juncus effusus]|nr:hypothetical protein LUZ60_004727 [Juncus effusus]